MAAVCPPGHPLDPGGVFAAFSNSGCRFQKASPLQAFSVEAKYQEKPSAGKSLILS
jgi:glutamine amidotransferase-like uncharacterized protein